MRVRSASELPAGYRAQVERSGALSFRPLRKYRNVPVTVCGERFDSKLEARCYMELVMEQQAGRVLWFLRQVPFVLEGRVVYRCDFLVVRPEGVQVIDAKGRDTQASRNKRKQVKARYGVEVQLWTD